MYAVIFEDRDVFKTQEGAVWLAMMILMTLEKEEGEERVNQPFYT